MNIINLALTELKKVIYKEFPSLPYSEIIPLRNERYVISFYNLKGAKIAIEYIFNGDEYRKTDILIMGSIVSRSKRFRRKSQKIRKYAETNWLEIVNSIYRTIQQNALIKHELCEKFTDAVCF